MLHDMVRTVFYVRVNIITVLGSLLQVRNYWGLVLLLLATMNTEMSLIDLSFEHIQHNEKKKEKVYHTTNHNNINNNNDNQLTATQPLFNLSLLPFSKGDVW